MRSGMKISCARKIEVDPRSVDLLYAMHDRFGKTGIAWEVHACKEAEFEIKVPQACGPWGYLLGSSN